MVDLTYDDAELDSGDSEGSVHESTANTDYTDVDAVRQGYSGASPPFQADAQAFYLLQEDSGSTTYDFSGNNRDGTINGPTVDVTPGLLDTSVYSFDGANDVVDLPFHPSQPLSAVAWCNADATGSNDQAVSLFDDGTYAITLRNFNGTWQVWCPNTSISGTSVTTGRWTFIAFTWDQTTLEFYQGDSSNGFGSQGTATPSSLGTSGTILDTIGGDDANGNLFSGEIGPVGIYDRALTASEVESIYDVVASAGETLTPWQTA